MKYPSNSYTARYAKARDILFNALMPVKPEIMKGEQLPLTVQDHITTGSSEELHIVSVRWLTGHAGAGFTENLRNLPPSKKVLPRYFQCFLANPGGYCEGVK